MLRVVLPKSLGFQRITINPPEVILETATGPFSFDAVSGGIAALIDITWQFYMCSLVAAKESFVVIIDEPENHLHPELQRSLLPNLVRAFPGTQIIAATHNPFMVTSSPDAKVFALTYVDGRVGPERRVVSSALDLENRATSANDILRDVLGVPSAMPVWVEERIAGIVERYSGRTLDESAFRQLRQEMATIGMAHVFPETVAKVMQRRV